MKKIKKIIRTAVPVLLAAVLFLYFSLSPVIAQKLKTFRGTFDVSGSLPKRDLSKKTVLIVADNDGTELFDLLAPFYLFNATDQANVFVVSEKKGPILLVNSLYILPHFSFAEIDSIGITPDVLVIPNVTVRLKTPPRERIVSWVKSQVKPSTLVLSICDGSATAAATGLYDGKPLTTHATDFKTLKKQFHKPLWVKNTSVTESGNLYSTAGVSNAVEGSLTVIKRLFGTETARAVAENIAYPHDTIRVAHQSEVVGIGAVLKIASKVLFKKNYRMGVLLEDQVNEFDLASLLDTYVRTFPSAINTFSVNGGKTISKYGLTLYPTGDAKADAVNEIHVLSPMAANTIENHGFTKAAIIRYDESPKKYPIDICLERIKRLYGNQFSQCVKLMLDYN